MINTPSRCQGTKGFTLMEVLIAMGIGLLIMNIAYSIIFFTRKSIARVDRIGQVAALMDDMIRWSVGPMNNNIGTCNFPWSIQGNLMAASIIPATYSRYEKENGGDSLMYCFEAPKIKTEDTETLLPYSSNTVLLPTLKPRDALGAGDTDTQLTAVWNPRADHHIPTVAGVSRPILALNVVQFSKDPRARYAGAMERKTDGTLLDPFTNLFDAATGQLRDMRADIDATGAIKTLKPTSIATLYFRLHQ